MSATNPLELQDFARSRRTQSHDSHSVPPCTEIAVGQHCRHPHPVGPTERLQPIAGLARHESDNRAGNPDAGALEDRVGARQQLRVTKPC